MRVLGIETSCDETSAAIVEESGDDAARPWRVRCNVVASQVDIHRAWGGIVPELSARQHIRDICGVVERAVDDAGPPAAGERPYDLIAVTQGPGLVGSLLVGLSFAKSLAWAHGVPFVPVHHLAGHIESLVLEGGEMPLPAVVLVVSGGHTSLYRVAAPGAYERLGRTRDDAAGEAYDKVAKLLGLGYPGGPVIDRLAADGNDRAVALPKTRLTHPDRNAPELPGRRDFSFSGLKTSVARHVALRRTALGLGRRGTAASERSSRPVRQLPARGGGVAPRRALRRGPGVGRAFGRHCRRCVGQQPAAARRGGAGRGRRPAGVRAAPQPLHRQCGDDCGGGPARVSRRGARRLGASMPTRRCR